MISAIEDVLRHHMGLEASTIGTATVERAIRARMAHVSAASTDEYLLRLRENPAELDELTEALVVPESWFFRDGAPFAALTAWTREQWLPAHPGATLRILTVPCSTGEEPASVAMALLDSGLPPERFTVTAVDISRRALARAERAVYGPNSFRGHSLQFRDRFFTPTPDGYALAPQVRRQIRFEHGNLLAPDFRPGAGGFDVIFCRNVLIYFDRPTQTRAIHALARILASDGLLFVGHAETAVAISAGLTSTNHPMAFGFRKAAPAPVAPLLSFPASPRPTASLPRASYRTPRVPTTSRFGGGKAPSTRTVPYLTPRPDRRETLRIPARPPLPAAPSDPLENARTLADRGQLAEATRLCEDHLRRDGAAAATWYLLGVIREAAGDLPRAAECYAKTLYLEPDHADALLHRALLAEQTGDAATAAQLRRRLARVQERSVRP